MNRITHIAMATAVALTFAAVTHAASVWQEIGGSATLTATAQNIRPVTNLRNLFGAGWEVFTKNPESATYSWSNTQRIAYVMIGGNPRTEGHLDDLVVEYSVDDDGTWVTVPENYDVSYAGSTQYQSVYMPIDVNAKAVRVTLDKPTNTASFENMGLYGFRVYGSSNTALGPMNESQDILANATVALTGDWRIDNVATTAPTAQARWDNDEAPGGNTNFNQGLNARLNSGPASATFTWAAEQVLAGMEIANMRNAFNTGGMIDEMSIEVLDAGVDPLTATAADWTTQFVYDAASEPSDSVLIDALFADGTLSTRAVRMNIDSAFIDNGTNFNAHIEEIAFVGGVVPEPASMALLGIGSVLMLRRRR